MLLLPLQLGVVLWLPGTVATGFAARFYGGPGLRGLRSPLMLATMAGVIAATALWSLPWAVVVAGLALGVHAADTFVVRPVAPRPRRIAGRDLSGSAGVWERVSLVRLMMGGLVFAATALPFAIAAIAMAWMSS